MRRPSARASFASSSLGAGSLSPPATWLAPYGVPPVRVADVPLASVGLRTRYDVTIVAFKRRGNSLWDIADRDVTLYTDDEILVAGSPKKVEAFSELDKDADA